MIEPIKSLIRAAICAPSGDNTQPWQFVIDPQSSRVVVIVNQSRDSSPMNAGGRMARIAVGAALENIVWLASRHGLELEFSEPPPHAAACFRVGVSPDRSIPIDSPIAARVTNRRPYENRPVPHAIISRLEQSTPELNGVVTHWITDRDRISELAELVGRADATMFGEPTMRQAFLAKVRFDQPAKAAVEDGLSLGSLELKGFQRAALMLMRRTPNWLLKAGGATAAFKKLARMLVNSSAGLCLLVAPDAHDQTDLVVGRAMQRAWLGLAEHNLAAQPMMSLLVLENVLDNREADLLASLGRKRLQDLRDELRCLAPEIAGGRPAFLLRFGFAPPPSGRTGRLPVETVTRNALLDDPVGESKRETPL